MSNKNSTGYIFIYAAILIVIVATLLSVAAVVLAPFQQRNKDNEKMCNILNAAAIPNVSNDNAQALFDKHCTQMLLLDGNGNILDDSGKAFNTNLKQELYNKEQGNGYSLPLFVINNGTQNINVIPLQGNGLWGAIWGYIAIADDCNTVVGANFDHASETPGLGAEITTEKFQHQFKGKTIMKNGQFVSIKVQKGGIITLPETDREHAVDAISGGSITSKGVDEMINKVLSCYLPYFEKQHKEE